MGRTRKQARCDTKPQCIRIAAFNSISWKNCRRLRKCTSRGVDGAGRRSLRFESGSAYRYRAIVGRVEGVPGDLGRRGTLPLQRQRDVLAGVCGIPCHHGAHAARTRALQWGGGRLVQGHSVEGAQRCPQARLRCRAGRGLRARGPRHARSVASRGSRR